MSTVLGGFLARIYVSDCDYVLTKYNVKAIRQVQNVVAEAVEIAVPFNNYITGYCALTHKAGIHAKTVLSNPSAYEILRPEDFRMSRYVSIGHRLTGWNAVKDRIEQLQLNDLTDEDADKIKQLADDKTLTLKQIDVLLLEYNYAKVTDSLHLLVPQNIVSHDQLLLFVANKAGITV